MPFPTPIQEGDDISQEDYNYLVAAYNERAALTVLITEVFERNEGDDILEYDAHPRIRYVMFDSGSADWLDGDYMGTFFDPRPFGEYWVDETSFPAAAVAGLTTDSEEDSAHLVRVNSGFANEANIRTMAGYPSGFTIGHNDFEGRDIDPETMNEMYNFFKAMQWYAPNGTGAGAERVAAFNGGGGVPSEIISSPPEIRRYTFTTISPYQWKAFFYDQTPNEGMTTATLIAVGAGAGPGEFTIDRQTDLFNIGYFVWFSKPVFAYCPW